MSEGALEMLKYGFEENTRCLGFRVSLDSKDSLEDALNAIGPYNDFDPLRVFEAITSIGENLAPYNGVALGREYSPVVYLRLDYDKKTKAIKDAVVKAMESTGADEIDWESEDTLRVWFD